MFHEDILLTLMTGFVVQGHILEVLWLLWPEPQE